MRRKARKRVGQQPAGFIMFITLAFSVLLGLASVVAIGPSVGEALKTGQELRDKRLFFLADGGATLCRAELKNRLNQALPARLASVFTVSTLKSPYVDADDPAQFLKDYAYDAANAGLYVGGVWTKDSTTQAHLPVSYSPGGGAGQYQCAIQVTSRAAPESSVSSLGTVLMLFRYSYTITGTATEGLVTRTVTLEGAFSILVQQDNFARYALFTNDQGGVWIADGFNYYGPVHTNNELWLKQMPHFWDTVESVSMRVRFGNGAAPATPVYLEKGVNPVWDHNGTIDVPIYDKGLNVGMPNIALPGTTTANAQRAIAQTGISPSATPGVYLGADNDKKMTGGIYVMGDAAIALSAPLPGIAQYAITQGANAYTVLLNHATKETRLTLGDTTSTYTGLPNGLLFVEGAVTSLAGTLESHTQLSVAATKDVTITNHLVYETYTPAAGSTPPNALGTTNLMGIISWNNNIHIGTSAPDNLNIHATLMAPSVTTNQGQVLVDSYNSGSYGSLPNSSPPRGYVNVLGGVIMNTYGAFGTVAGNPPNQTYTGYGRNFVYDRRMMQGMAPRTSRRSASRPARSTASRTGPTGDRRAEPRPPRPPRSPVPGGRPRRRPRTPEDASKSRGSLRDASEALRGDRGSGPRPGEQEIVGATTPPIRVLESSSLPRVYPFPLLRTASTGPSILPRGGEGPGGRDPASRVIRGLD